MEGGGGEEVEGEEVAGKGKGKLKLRRRILHPPLILSPKFLNQGYLSPFLPDGVFNLHKVWPILWVVLPQTVHETKEGGGTLGREGKAFP